MEKSPFSIILKITGLGKNHQWMLHQSLLLQSRYPKPQGLTQPFYLAHDFADQEVKRRLSAVLACSRSCGCSQVSGEASAVFRAPLGWSIQGARFPWWRLVLAVGLQLNW